MSQFRLFLSACLAAALTAALGTALTAGGAGRLHATLAAFALGLAPGFLLGLVQWVIARLLGGPWSRLTARVERYLDPRRDAPREPVVMLHATTAAVALSLGLLAIGAKLVLVRLRSVEDEDVAENLGILAICALFLLMAGLAVLLQPVARRVFAWLDGTIGLPLPKDGRARLLVWLALPMVLVSEFGLLLLEEALGPLAAPLWLALALGLQLGLYALLRFVPVADHLALRLVPLVLALLGFGVAHALLQARAETTTTLDQARPGSYLANGARLATDVDGDGASALFGGGDCAPFSYARGPYARDKPGNRIDENCDGKDSVAGSAPKLATYFEKPPPRTPTRPDVVWFVVDALRADHTSLLGYPHPTTPVLEELARESLVFTNAYSQSSATMLSFPSMLSGIDPGRLVWREEKGRLQLGEGQDFLSKRLEKLGYQTGFVASTYMRDRLPGLVQDWNWVGYLAEGKHSSATTAARAASFLVEAQKSKKPFFLLVYLLAPHAPYFDHGKEIPRMGAGKTALYDEEIVDADRHIGFMLDLLKSDQKRWKNTIVVVNADHGEEFGEHGGDKHARTCHVESVHVPLVVRLPGRAKKRVTNDVGLIDIVPTLLEAVSAPSSATRPELDGQSLLVPTLTPEKAPTERPLYCSVISQNVQQGEFLRRSVKAGRFKLMKELRGVNERALYDVKRDPKEKTPVTLEGQALRTADELDAAMSAQFTGNLRDANLND